MEKDDVAARFEPVQRSKRFNWLLSAYGLRHKKVLDLGCGFGEHLAHFGPGSVGLTTTQQEIDYARGRGLDVRRGNVELIDTIELEKDFEVIWANNLIEHLISPHAFLMKLRMFAPHGRLIISADVVPGIPALMRIRKFRGALAAAHVSVFTLRTFRMTVERAGWQVKEYRPFVFRNAMIDRLFGFIAPNVYLIAENNPDFKYPSKKLLEWGDEPLYADMLQSTGQR